jgi:integrase
MGQLAKLQSGINTNHEKREERIHLITLQQAVDEYFHARKSLKPYTIRDYQCCMKNYFPDWAGMPLNAITRDKVSERHSKLGQRSRARANMAMRFLRAVFNFAIVKYEPHIVNNPVRHLSLTKAWYRIDRRRSVIKIHELRPWFEAVSSLGSPSADESESVVRDYLLFMLFTGLRPGEAAQLEKKNVDFRSRTVTLIDTKNGDDFTLPMTEYVKTILEPRCLTSGGEYVFPSHKSPAGHITVPRRVILRVCAASGIQFRPHDLRRTFITVAERLDVSAYALKRLLNHRINNDVTAGYIISDVERLRKPMDRIASVILRAVGMQQYPEIFQLPTAELQEASMNS